MGSKRNNINKVFIIAEAGVNHNGSLRMARRLIYAAAKAGADAIKFQTFRACNVATSYAPKACYQKKNGGGKESQLQMLKHLELSFKQHKDLIDYCKRKHIIFLSSAFDLESIGLLHRLGLRTLKIPSGEITNLPYLRRIGSLRKKIILSTGMACMKEVRNALNILLKEGTRKEDITVLHCNTEYPTPFSDVNLRAMLTIRDTLHVKVGYSDHTAGIETAIAACALGASVIEKHFTIDKNMDGPDHKASLEPPEFKTMVEAIRNVEKSIGSGIKKPSPSEIKNIVIARKSIVATRHIRKGDVFTENNITTKRPAKGISSMQWDKIIGRSAKQNFKEDELIIL